MNPEVASALDSINVNLNVGGMNTINAILSFVMFGVALGIKPRIFVDVFKIVVAMYNRVIYMCSENLKPAYRIRIKSCQCIKRSFALRLFVF